MHPLGTKVYLLKRDSPSDSFCGFFSESVGPFKCTKAFLYWKRVSWIRKLFTEKFGKPKLVLQWHCCETPFLGTFIFKCVWLSQH